MQAAGVIAGLLLVGLMSISGFQLVPESSGNINLNTTSPGDSGPQLRVTDRVTAAANVSAVATELVQIVTVIDTKSPQNVEQTTATLRGDVTLGQEELGVAFFVYGYDQAVMARAVRSITSYQAFLTDIPESVSVKSVTRSIRRSGEVSVRVGSLASDTKYYTQLCVEVGSSVRCGATVSFDTAVGARRPGDVQLPTIRLADEAFITANEVQFGATVTMRDTKDGRVYLLYGESRTLVERAMKQDYSDIDESAEFLQKSRLATNVRGVIEVSKLIDDLEEETEHYYAICVSYDGLLDGFICSRLQSFTTYDDDFGDTPVVRTLVPTTVGTQAVLGGNVRMSSFRNGQVFFVYGTDTSRIERIGGEMSMQNVRQSGDRQQRVIVDTDLDRTDSYNTRVTDLLPEMAYAARLCVEYKNQNDNYRDVRFVECGAVQLFMTN